MKILDFRFPILDLTASASRAHNPKSKIQNPKYVRRGVTILEVLWAILVTSVGLFGAIALFPFASAQARKARLFDAMAAAGRSAVHDFDVRGMRRPDKWFYWNGTSYVQVPSQNGQPQIGFGTCICIDPRLIAANGASGATAGYFPYSAANNAPRMYRVSLASGVQNILYMTPLQAENIFVFDDDLTFARPGVDDVSRMPAPNNKADRSLPAFQQFDNLPPPNATTRGKRQTSGHLSWMATLVPRLEVFGAAQFNDEYVLSIVVFNDRPADLSVADPLHERTLEASVVAGSDGSTGGEFVLHWTVPQTPANEESALNVLKLRANDWILLAGSMVNRANNPATVIAHRFQWYRVAQCDHEPTYNAAPGQSFTGNGYEINVTLVGQDWDTTLVNPLNANAMATPPTVTGTAQATIVQGVAAVYEKTIRLDYGSAF